MNVLTLCQNMESLIAIMASEGRPPTNPENDYTINALIQLLQSLKSNIPDQQVSNENLRSLLDFLGDRWDRICNTNLAYSHSPKGEANIISLALAQLLEDVYGISRYQILMPTIKILRNEISATEIKENSLELQEFILSDDNERIIDVIPCLDFAAEDGVLKHTSLYDGKVKNLNESEMERIIHHSVYTQAYYASLMERFEAKIKSKSFGSQLLRLTEALRAGGVHGKGRELDAAHNANEGILHFSQWLETLTQKDKDFIFSLRTRETIKDLGEIWHRLARPTDSNFRETIYCVDLISHEIERILEHNPGLFDHYPENDAAAKVKCVEWLTQEVEVKRKQLVIAMHSNNYVVTSKYQNKGGGLKLCLFLGPRIKNLDELVFALTYLSEQHYDLLINNMPMFKIIDSKGFIYILGSLPISARSVLIKAVESHLPQILNTHYEFRHFYLRLPEDLKPQFKSWLFEKCITANNFYAALNMFPIIQRLSLVERYSFSFTKCVKTADEFITILNLLLPQERIQLVVRWKHSLKNINEGELQRILSYLLPEDRVHTIALIDESLAKMVNTFDQFFSLFVLFEKDKRMFLIEDFGSYLYNMIMNGHQLGRLLAQLSFENQHTLIINIGTDLKKIIQLSDQLVSCLYLLSIPNQAVLIKILGDELKDIFIDKNDFEDVLPKLPIQTRKLLRENYNQTPEISNNEKIQSSQKRKSHKAKFFSFFYNRLHSLLDSDKDEKQDLKCRKI